MSVALKNKFSFPAELVEKSVTFPSGCYVEVNDLVFEQNGLGRKIVQTQLVQIDGKEASVGYMNDANGDGTGYELILADEMPVNLGDLDSIIRGNPVLFAALQQAFGNSMSSYAHIEMVIAIMKAVRDGAVPNDAVQMRNVAGWARIQAKRASWVLKHRMDALIQSPVDWRSLGL